jgi:hypothetical protein
MSESLIRLLAGLPTAQSDPDRADRIRARCRERLARAAPRRPPRSTMAFAWQPLLAALGVVYLVDAVVQGFLVWSSKF